MEGRGQEAYDFDEEFAMNDSDNPPGPAVEAPRKRDWSGFGEIDRAIAEDRLTEYRWKKAWADPWNRRAAIAVVFILLLGWSYIAGAGLGWW
jgi:hypothetical protein